MMIDLELLILLKKYRFTSDVSDDLCDSLLDDAGITVE